jgi:hypothetical protein
MCRTLFGIVGYRVNIIFFELISKISDLLHVISEYTKQGLISESVLASLVHLVKYTEPT